MGFIRGGAVFILTTILFLSLFVGNIFLTLTWSLDYETVKPSLQNITAEVFQTSLIEAAFADQLSTIQTFCLTNPSFDFSLQGEIIPIACDKILQGPETIINQQTEEILEENYYKEYDCELFDCVKQDPLVLVSEKSKNYWNSKFNTILIFSIVVFLLLFLISKDKHTALIISGIILIVTAIPFKKITLLTNLFKDVLPFDIITIFFSKAESVFLVMTIIGLIFVIFGFSVGFLKWGNKISEFLNKIIKRKREEEAETNLKEEVKNIVKKERTKKNKNFNPKKQT